MAPSARHPEAAGAVMERGAAGRLVALAVCLVVLAAMPGRAGSDGPADADPSPETIAALIRRLGDPDYQRRETATARLQEIGAAAVDTLLAAAETDADLEVALRARWIVDAIPLEMLHDSPEVGRLLEGYSGRPMPQRLRTMERLLRLEDDAGVEALARLVRLERDPEGARIAAALIAGEWFPDDPWWPRIAARTRTGLGRGERPAAAFLSALVGFSETRIPPERAAAIDAARRALEAMEHAPGGDAAPDRAGEPAAGGAEPSGATARLARALVRMLLADGRRAEALAEAERHVVPVVAAAVAGSAEDTIEWLTWGVESGLPELADQVAAVRPDLAATDPLVALATAVARRARGDMPAATALFDDAAKRLENATGLPLRQARMQAAFQLSRQGCDDWAIRIYTAILDDVRSLPNEIALGAIYGSEYLHELERDDEAAAFMRRLFEPVPGRPAIRADQVLGEIGRDVRSARARMHFFASCAAAARGDAGARRELVEAALREDVKEIDSLIALHQLPDNTPDQRGDAQRRVNEALRQIENEITALPDDSTPCNEWAWLAANTGGDADKATRYSRQSLDRSFDNASFLDTLAHCRAAAGDFAGAVRCQTLAVRRAPHNHTILKGLERFRRQAQAAEPAP
jgi:tetratricopeptide (TPR) repeat protein